MIFGAIEYVAKLTNIEGPLPNITKQLVIKALEMQTLEER